MTDGCRICGVQPGKHIVLGIVVTYTRNCGGPYCDNLDFVEEDSPLEADLAWNELQKSGGES